MSRKRYSTEQIITKLREAEVLSSLGRTVPENIHRQKNGFAKIWALQTYGFTDVIGQFVGPH